MGPSREGRSKEEKENLIRFWEKDSKDHRTNSERLRINKKDAW